MMNKKREDKNSGPYAIWHIEGGHGKGILCTAVISAFKKQFPEYKVIILTAWDAPWFFNPDVYRVYLFGSTTYFYDDYMFDDTKVFKLEPYHTEDHILERKHLINTWCDMYGIKYNGEQPKLYFNPRELEVTKDKIKPNQGKPIFILQTHGGALQQYSKKSWARDIPIEIAQSIVNYYSKNYRILHIRREDQPVLNGVEYLALPHRELYVTFMFSKKRLLIDSFSQHAAMALGLQSVVCWIATKPEIFGYKENINILPNANLTQEMNKFSYVDQYDISGQIQQFPYDTVNLFDTNKIVESLNKLTTK